MFLDGTSVRAHQKAASAKGGPGARARALPRRLGQQGLCGLRRPRPAARPRAEGGPGLELLAAGAEPVVRPHPTHTNAPAHDRAAYARRHRTGYMWARLKEWRAVATRNDKTAVPFLGGLYFAAALDWLTYRP